MHWRQVQMGPAAAASCSRDVLCFDKQHSHSLPREGCPVPVQRSPSVRSASTLLEYNFNLALVTPSYLSPFHKRHHQQQFRFLNLWPVTHEIHLGKGQLKR